jgi:anaerobic ribonucleoside-triphosphate reductase activating protein
MPAMSDGTLLKISHMEESSTLLGPYERFIIWVHGCCFDCEGCVAENTKNGAYEEVKTDGLARWIASSPCEGITVSGGEPFLQAKALADLIGKIKKHRDIGVIVYSGFTLEEIKQDKEKIPFLSCIDVLIDGRYVKALDDNRAYVGSSNQVIHYLSQRYADIGKTYYAAEKRRAEIKLTGTQAILIGVPSHSVLKTWQDIKEKSGGMRNDF